MAETYSQQYQNLFITKPAVRTNWVGVPTRLWPFDYVQTLVGTAADTCVIAQLPALSMILTPSCCFYHEAFTAAMNLSVGWKGYVDVNGVAQPLNATGLYNAADVSNGVGMIMAGMDTVATPDDMNPLSAGIKIDFQNATPIDIFVTFVAQAPGANAILRGYLIYANLA